MTRTILIVDDNEHDQLFNQRALRDIDCTVKIAATIAAGLELAASNAFDAILLDYNLPDGNGLDFMARIGAAEAEHVPPIVMLTGAGNEAVAVEAIKAGAYDYLIKDGEGRHRKLLPAVVQRVMREHAVRKAKREAERQLQLAAAALAANNEALHRSNEELQSFAHVAAHDLQAPLSAIAGCAELLREECAGTLGEEGEKWLGHILGNTRRMQTLIHDLLSYARLDAQAQPFAAADLNMVFDEVVSVLKQPIGRANAEVSRADLPVLDVDRQQMYRLLTNLIENGIKYNRTATPRVRVSAMRQEDAWLFAVQDNGIGIDASHHAKVFEIFRRLHGSGEFPGSGIGLAVCQRIVVRHGGRIWVESQEGKGSVFYFTLPAARAVSA